MQARNGNSGYNGGKNSYGSGNKGGQRSGSESTTPAYRLKKKVGNGDLEVIGGAFTSTPKNGGAEYYKVSKTPFIIFQTEKGDLALKMKPEDENAKLVTVAYLKPATSQNGATYYTGKAKEGDETFFLYPYEKKQA